MEGLIALGIIGFLEILLLLKVYQNYKRQIEIEKKGTYFQNVTIRKATRKRVTFLFPPVTLIIHPERGELYGNGK